MPDIFRGGLGADTIEGGAGPHGDAFVVRS
jgi:hypothetical protein